MLRRKNVILRYVDMIERERKRESERAREMKIPFEFFRPAGRETEKERVRIRGKP